jgi:hypothetical protein
MQVLYTDQFSAPPLQHVWVPRERWVDPHTPRKWCLATRFAPIRLFRHIPERLRAQAPRGPGWRHLRRVEALGSPTKRPERRSGDHLGSVDGGRPHRGAGPVGEGERGSLSECSTVGSACDLAHLVATRFCSDAGPASISAHREGAVCPRRVSDSAVLLGTALLGVNTALGPGLHPQDRRQERLAGHTLLGHRRRIRAIAGELRRDWAANVREREPLSREQRPGARACRKWDKPPRT